MRKYQEINERFSKQGWQNKKAKYGVQELKFQTLCTWVEFGATLHIPHFLQGQWCSAPANYGHEGASTSRGAGSVPGQGTTILHAAYAAKKKERKEENCLEGTQI